MAAATRRLSGSVERREHSRGSREPIRDGGANGEGAAPLALKQMCRCSHAGPAESGTVPAPGEGAERCLAASTRCLPLVSRGHQSRARSSGQPWAPHRVSLCRRARDKPVPPKAAAPWPCGNPKYYLVLIVHPAPLPRDWRSRGCHSTVC